MRTKRIWGGKAAVVLQDEKGGLRYRYCAVNHADKPWCEFSLFCEVGEPYKYLFTEFFKTHIRATYVVDYGNHSPYIADTLEIT